MSFNKIRLLKSVNEDDYLKLAEATAKWIRSKEIRTTEGKHWQIGEAKDDSLEKVDEDFLNTKSLYSGAAGIGYFFLQLYQVTHNATYLEDAKEAANYLIHTYRNEDSKNPGIYSGTSGQGIFLYLLSEITQNDIYKEKAINIADDIYEQAEKTDTDLHWNGFFDYMGDGGAIAYWIHTYTKTNDLKYLKYAKQALDTILSMAIVREDGSVYWKLFDPHQYFKTVPKGGVVPNFAHGTAGIVYLLTKYYNVTKEKEYLEYAVKGSQFLKNIAIYEDEAAIVPYLYMEDEDRPYDVFYLGFCHGPVGDGITYRELYQTIKDPGDLDFYHKLSKALLKAGAPDQHSTGYWNHCLCCGTSGVLMHFLDAYHVTGEKEYLEDAKKTAAKLYHDAYQEEAGARWYDSWTRIQPWNVDAHLGLFVGAAGNASALLTLYASLHDIEMSPIFEYEH